MNILLTNDDGVYSDGLQKLAHALRSRGKHRVFVIAPETNRSGISNAISILNGPVKLSRLEEDTWSCSGYPADCVIAAFLGALPVKPDLVLSGINHGENTGTALVYSGTAAAARQAGIFGIPGLALSLSGLRGYYWDMAAAWSVDNLEKLAAYWREDTFLNINIPNSENGPRGILMAWPAVSKYRDKLSIMTAPDSNRWCFLEMGENLAKAEAGSDNDVISRNYVSVSSVCIHQAVLKDLCPEAPPYAAVARRGGNQE